MKSVFLLLCILCVAWCGLATAGGQPDNDPDLIGIYFDEQADSFCNENLEGMFNTYLVLTNLTSPSIGGWEAKITCSGGGFLASATPRGLAINAGTREDEYIVGLGNPLIANDGLIVVMDISYYILDVLDPFYVYVGPIYYHVTPELLPAYLDGDDMNLAKPLNPSQGSIEDPVLSANDNCTGPVDTEASSWGAVKSIFR